MRAKRGVVRHRKHKKLLDRAKGFYGQRKNVFKRAKEALLHAGNFAFRDRRAKKRVFRQSWIQTINTACRLNGMKYSEFIAGMKKAKINLNRKILSEIAQTDAKTFSEIIKQVKSVL